MEINEPENLCNDEEKQTYGRFIVYYGYRATIANNNSEDIQKHYDKNHNNLFNNIDIKID